MTCDELKLEEIYGTETPAATRQSNCDSHALSCSQLLSARKPSRAAKIVFFWLITVVLWCTGAHIHLSSQVWWEWGGGESWAMWCGGDASTSGAGRGRYRVTVVMWSCGHVIWFFLK